MKKLRSWVTPITIGSFLLLGVTGLLMFFKVRGGLIVVAHEWLSPIFVVGACLHIFLNRTIDDFLNGSVMAQMDHFATGGMNNPAHNIDSSIMTVKK